MISTYCRCILVLMLATQLPVILGQFTSTSTSSSEKTRAEPYIDDKGAPLDQPDKPLKILKTKGVVERVDLRKRTVTIASEKKRYGSLELTFPQPSGLEQIKTSKKIFKVLGKKNLSLEDLGAGSKVRLQYYPLLGQVAELIVEKKGP